MDNNHMQEEILERGKIKLPGNYFANTKHDYNNWTQAWFREAIQNSVDAGATNIDFKIVVDPDKPGSLIVTCQDDGVGMDKRVLTEVFLAMGGSEKPDGAIGGFGHAKILLAFAHVNYEIETQGVRVNGVGDDWQLVKADASQGVRLKVEMDTKEVSEWRLQSSLHDIVHHSTFKEGVKISLNGETLMAKVDSHPYKQGTALGDLSFKDLPHGYDTSSLWVRMNGLAMFRQSIYSRGETAFEGYLDLSASSKDILTSNRDALTKDQSSVLNEILQTLANDREKLKLGGDIDLLLNEKEFSLYDLPSAVQGLVLTEAATLNISANEFLDRLVAMADNDNSVGDKNPFRSLIDDAKKAMVQRDSKIKNIPADWYPLNFKVKFADGSVNPEESHKFAGNISATMSKKKFGKLAAGWNRIVKTLLENESYREVLGVHKSANGEFYRGESMIQTGFVFGKPAGLNTHEEDKKRISIMVNPDYVTEQDFSVGDLVALAQHELTHVAVSGHYESFTDAEFKIRRVARGVIGHNKIEKAFSEACAEWREIHSGNKVTEKRQVQREVEESYGYN